MAPGLRANTQVRRAARGNYADHDDFEGLPIRQWRQEWVDVEPPPTEINMVNDRWAYDLPHGLPKDTTLLTQHSQDLLRATRSGRIYKRPATPPVEELTDPWAILAAYEEEAAAPSDDAVVLSETAAAKPVKEEHPPEAHKPDGARTKATEKKKESISAKVKAKFQFRTDDATGKELTAEERKRKWKDDGSHGANGYRVRQWNLIARNAEGATISHLAKRRKDVITIASKTAPVQAAGPTVTRATVRRIDAAGNPYLQDVTLVEGQEVDGEIVARTTIQTVRPDPGAGATAGAAAQQAAAVRRRPIPQKRKGKGRGKKRKGPVRFKAAAAAAAPAAPGAVVDQTQAAELNLQVVAADGQPAEAQDVEMADRSNVHSDEEDGEEGEGEGEDGDDGDEGDGDDHDDDQEEAALDNEQDQQQSDQGDRSGETGTDSPEPAGKMSIANPDGGAGENEVEEHGRPEKEFAGPSPFHLAPPGGPLGPVPPRPEGSPLKHVMVASPTEPSPEASPIAAAFTSKHPLDEMPVGSEELHQQNLQEHDLQSDTLHHQLLEEPLVHNYHPLDDTDFNEEPILDMNEMAPSGMASANASHEEFDDVGNMDIEMHTDMDVPASNEIPEIASPLPAIDDHENQARLSEDPALEPANDLPMNMDAELAAIADVEIPPLDEGREAPSVQPSAPDTALADAPGTVADATEAMPAVPTISDLSFVESITEVPEAAVAEATSDKPEVINDEIAPQPTASDSAVFLAEITSPAEAAVAAAAVEVADAPDLLSGLEQALDEEMKTALAQVAESEPIAPVQAETEAEKTESEEKAEAATGPTET